MSRWPFALCLLGFVGAFAVLGCQPRSDATPDTASVDSSAALPDSVLTPADSTARRFEAAMDEGWTQRSKASSVGDLMQMIGLHFRGAPYLEGTLDAPARETLVVRLDGFDCVTFVETVLAMARGIRSADTTYAGFARRLAEQRYRDDRMLGYCSRLHYFTEWLTENDDKGIVKRLDAELGGRQMTDSLDFMSTHRSAYDRFADDDSLYACIQDMETRVRERHEARPVRFVPQDSIRTVYDQLQAGDIVAIATSIEGLDVSHTGLVYVGDDGSRGLLHASLSDGVVVSPDLQRYVQKIDHQIGIVVARPRPVR